MFHQTFEAYNSKNKCFPYNTRFMYFEKCVSIFAKITVKFLDAAIIGRVGIACAKFSGRGDTIATRARLKKSLFLNIQRTKR